MTSPDPSGRAVAVAVERALRPAGLASDAVDYVAAHGDGTREGDASEAAGLRQAFGGDGLLASSVKPATGNLVGAAGALNAAVAALAVARGAVPPTLNLEHVDPDCDGDRLDREGGPRGAGAGGRGRRARPRRPERDARAPRGMTRRRGTSRG